MVNKNISFTSPDFQALANDALASDKAQHLTFKSVDLIKWFSPNGANAKIGFECIANIGKNTNSFELPTDISNYKDSALNFSEKIFNIFSKIRTEYETDSEGKRKVDEINRPIVKKRKEMFYIKGDINIIINHDTKRFGSNELVGIEINNGEVRN